MHSKTLRDGADQDDVDFRVIPKFYGNMMFWSMGRDDMNGQEMHVVHVSSQEKTLQNKRRLELSGTWTIDEEEHE